MSKRQNTGVNYCNVKKIPISKMEFNATEYLKVFLPPGKYPSYFDMVYRSARGVYYNAQKKFFYIEFPTEKKFQMKVPLEKALQIVYEAVRDELGYELIFDDDIK